MKKINLKLLFLTVVLALFAYACEKESVNENDNVPDETSFKTPSLVKSETSPEMNPADLQEDLLLPDPAGDEILKYKYDNAGHLVRISYFNSVDTALSSDDALKLLMTDYFYYNTDNRISVLLRVYNSEPSPGIAPSIRKTYTYNRLGQLVKIVTEKPDATSLSALRQQIEVLQYNNAGLLYRKDVKTPLEAHYYLYKYDELRRLKLEALFSMEGIPVYYCEFNYDTNNNIAYKEYFYPNDVYEAVSGWIEKYEYDRNPNPFNDMKLPVSTLFETMDVISPNNYTMIANPDKIVRYKYQYDFNGYPILRVRVE